MATTTLEQLERDAAQKARAAKDAEAAAEKARREFEAQSIADQRKAFRDGAQAWKEQDAKFTAELEEAIKLRDEPENRVRRAEQARLSHRSQRAGECKRLNLCPHCHVGDFKHSNLIAVCKECGFRNDTKVCDSLQRAIAPPQPPPVAAALAALNEHTQATLNSKQFRQLLGSGGKPVSPQLFRAMRSEGKLPCPVGLSRGRLQWSRATVDAWLKEGMPRCPESLVGNWDERDDE